MVKRIVKYSRRLNDLPPYLFVKIDALKAEKRAQGVDIIDLGVGDPDQATPPYIVESLERAAHNPLNHRY
ncbi:MAG: LL-diaminopimelate aminotransferase, partial [Halobacteriota archaeon]